jgi:hypothetical protein
LFGGDKLSSADVLLALESSVSMQNTMQHGICLPQDGSWQIREEKWLKLQWSQRLYAKPEDDEMRLGFTTHMALLERLSGPRSTSHRLATLWQKAAWARAEMSEGHQLLKQARAIRQGNGGQMRSPSLLHCARLLRAKT